VGGARTGLVDLEDMSDEELEKLHKEFESLHKQVDTKLNKSHGKKKSSRSK